MARGGSPMKFLKKEGRFYGKGGTEQRERSREGGRERKVSDERERERKEAEEGR